MKCPLRRSRHPEVLGAQRRASKGDGQGASAGILRGSLCSHLRMTVLGMALSALVVFPVQSHAQSPEAFYKAHPITMLVGSGAGGGYDVYARAFARFLDQIHSGAS